MSDRWAEWLLLRRFAGSEDVRREFMEHLTRVREKVLDNAELASGDVLLDVGCGDGLIAFAGLERVAANDGADAVLVLNVNEDWPSRSEPGLPPSPRSCSMSADLVVTTSTDAHDCRRSRRAQRAFEEFFRVLRPGGRISLSIDADSFRRGFEPINHLSNFFTTYDVTQGSGAG
jgi:arsenite methyltransferase